MWSPLQSPLVRERKLMVIVTVGIPTGTPGYVLSIQLLKAIQHRGGAYHNMLSTSLHFKCVPFSRVWRDRLKNRMFWAFRLFSDVLQTFLHFSRFWTFFNFSEFLWGPSPPGQPSPEPA